MKNKYLKVMMTEEELNDLKEFTKKYGFKNASEAARESLSVFKAITQREPSDSNNYVKSCDASSILWAAKFLCSTFDIQEYFSNDNEENKGELNNILVDMYNNNEFDTLKKCVLTSILHDFVFSNEMDKELIDLIKNISIEYLKKK